MRRVVVTGLGIVSSIGNNVAEVTESLKAGRSGIEFMPEYKERGFRSQVAGTLKVDVEKLVDRRLRRFMGDGAAYAWLAMKEAIADAGLDEATIKSERTALIAGSGGPSTKAIVEAADTAREKGPKRIGPFVVPKAMSSTVSANLGTAYGVRGPSYSISSACSTSAHCIGNAYETILLGKADVAFAGGGEELDWRLSVLFDAMPAMSSSFNDQPTRASRAYDKDRDGFVISGGGEIVVLEDYERARARGAKIYGEIVGYGATADGADMVAPSGEGAVRCMRLALGGSGHNRPVDYINTHGTSTPVGDITELDAIREVFKDRLPTVSSTKSMTGHSQGATGAHEAIYTLLMLQHDFIAPSINIDNLDPGAADYPIARARIDDAGLERVMSNSFGFGGTNAVLLFQRVSMSPDSVGGPTSSDAASRTSGLMTGRRGLIMGVANDRSIAWGIAKACHAAGAELAFTYQGDVFGQRVKPLVSKLGAKLVLPADVEDDISLDALFDTLKKEWGRLDFLVHAIAFSDKEELKGRYVDTSRANFQRSLTISCFSLTDLARRAQPLMTNGGSLITLTYSGARHVMPSYNVMGVAKAALEASVRYLAADLGPHKIRVNAISAGPMRTLAAAVIGDGRYVYRTTREVAPLRRNIDQADVGGAALYLLSDLSAGVTGEVHHVDAGYHVMGMAPPSAAAGGIGDE